MFLAGVASASRVLAADDDRATAERLLQEVDRAPASQKALAADFVARGRAALARGAELRGKGEETHARLADGAARTWAEAAKDLLRAAEVEARAEAARRAATDAGTMAERERALLEEGVAQTGRLRAQLEAVSRERETRDPPAKTNKAGAQAPTRDAGAAPGAR